MNKKATTTLNILIEAFRMLGVVVLSIILIYLLTLSTKLKFNSFDAEADIYFNSLIYSSNGFSYYDSLSGRLYPGIIDSQRFNQDVTLSSQIAAAEFAVYDITGNKLLAEPVMLNKKGFDKWTALRGFTGAGGADAKEKRLYVLFRDNGRLTPALLKADIVIPRS